MARPPVGESVVALVPVLPLVAGLYQAWSAGANDETTAPAVSARTLRVNQAVVLGVVFGTMGAMVLGGNVQSTIGTGLLLAPLSDWQALIVLFSASLWLTAVSYFGFPVSTTHSTLGALIGVGVFTNGFGNVNWSAVVNVILGWLFSMFMGFFLSYVGTRGIIELKERFADPVRFEQRCAKLLVVCTFCLQFSRWGNDVADSSGVLSGLFNPFLIRLVCAISMAMGLFVLGRNVIRNCGLRLAALTPSVALVSQAVATPLIFSFALVGLPLSGTHVMISSMLGGGKALQARIDRPIVGRIAVSWALSFVVPALMAILFCQACLLIAL